MDKVSSRRPQVTVIGNFDAAGPSTDAAEQVGRMLGRLGCTVITGGGAGIMLAVCRGARETGGLTVGILPGNDLTGGNPLLDVVIPSGIGYARNMANVLSADFVIAIGGGAGTLSEIAYAWMHHRTVIALCGFGGWADKLGGERIDERRTDRIERADSIEGLEHIVRDKLRMLGYELP